MIIVLFSLAGLPPLSGFVAKFNIISVIIEKKYYGLAFIAAINSVISLYYYMKLVKVIVFENSDSDEQVKGFNFINQLTIVAFTAPVLFLGVFWEKVMMISAGAKIFINK
jgi:NADH-quinone oxidoreductase subunit N